MGLLSELFVATEEQAKAYAGEGAPAFWCAELTNLTNLEFERLWALLDGVDWDSEVHKMRAVSVSEEEWTFEFPRAFVERLLALEEREVADLAAASTTTEELGRTLAEAREVLDELIRVARRVERAEQAMFLWIAL